MTVYVDNWREHARGGRLTARWSHLMAGPWDDIEELTSSPPASGCGAAGFRTRPGRSSTTT